MLNERSRPHCLKCINLSVRSSEKYPSTSLLTKTQEMRRITIARDVLLQRSIVSVYTTMSKDVDLSLYFIQTVMNMATTTPPQILLSRKFTPSRSVSPATATSSMGSTRPVSSHFSRADSPASSTLKTHLELFAVWKCNRGFPFSERTVSKNRAGPSLVSCISLVRFMGRKSRNARNG